MRAMDQARRSENESAAKTLRLGFAAGFLIVAGLAVGGTLAAESGGGSGGELDGLSKKLVHGAAAVPGAMAGCAEGPFRMEGAVQAFWRTSQGASPLSRGTFVLMRDGSGGLRLRAEMPVLGPIEYGVAGDLAWETDPVFGARRLEGDSRRTLRRVLEAVLGGGDVRALYETGTRDPASVATGAEVVLLAPSADPGDRYELAASGPYLERAAISHHNAAGEVQLLSIEHGKPGESLPGEVTIEREHYRFVLRPEKIQRGADAVASIRAPGSASGAEPEEPRDLRDPVLRNISEIPVASIRAKVSLREISKELATMLPEAMRAVGEQGIPPIGPPFTRYFNMATAGDIDIEAGFPVARPITASGRVKPGTLPAGQVASVWHIGPYHTVGQTHQRLMAWVAQRGLAPSGGPWEIYWTDPGLEPDSSRWRTEVVLPVRSVR